MLKMNKRIFSIFTFVYFLLGFVYIYFSYLALFCMAIPFLILIKNKKNNWCSGLCPRADYLNLFRFINFGKKPPEWLIGDKMKNNIIVYFCLNLVFIILSTLMVSLDRIVPIDKVRLFIVLQLPWDMPQLWAAENSSPILLHLAYRFYSLMLSSTILGTILAIVYKPRTWCVICPVQTLSTRYLKQLNDTQSELTL
jgi:hypothetical protein